MCVWNSKIDCSVPCEISGWYGVYDGQPFRAVEHLVGDRRDVVVVAARRRGRTPCRGRWRSSSRGRRRTGGSRSPTSAAAGPGLARATRPGRRRTDRRSSGRRSPRASRRRSASEDREELHLFLLLLRDVLARTPRRRHELADLDVGRELQLDQPAVAVRVVVDDPGLADRLLLTATTSPETGVKSSETAFTDSTVPNSSPASYMCPTSGSSR